MEPLIAFVVVCILLWAWGWMITFAGQDALISRRWFKMYRISSKWQGLFVKNFFIICFITFWESCRLLNFKILFEEVYDFMKGWRGFAKMLPFGFLRSLFSRNQIKIYKYMTTNFDNTSGKSSCVRMRFRENTTCNLWYGEVSRKSRKFGLYVRIWWGFAENLEKWLTFGEVSRKIHMNCSEIS